MTNEQNPRSSEAYQSIDPVVKLTTEERIIACIVSGQRRGMHGATTYECEVAIGGKHQSISAAVSGLYHDKRQIRPSGYTRPTDTGRRADVYEIGDPQAADAPIPPALGQADRRGTPAAAIVRPNVEPPRADGQARLAL